MSNQLYKVLYVEDDEDIAMLTLITLKKFGQFEVKHCVNGKEALSVFSEFRPQLVILDVMMPVMDGPETLSHIRALEQGQDTPVIFMTAKAQSHEQQNYLDLGAIGVIVKPYDPLSLCDRLAELWNGYHQ